MTDPGSLRVVLALLAALGVSLSAPAFAAGGARPAQTSAIVFERSGDLYAVALDGSRIVRLTVTHSEESAPAVSTDGRRLAFARGIGNGYGGGIWTSNLDGTHQTRLTHFGRDSEPAWAPDGRTIYFVRYESGLSPDGPCGVIYRIGIDGRNLRLVASPARFHSIEQPAVSPDGRRIAFSDWDLCSGGTSSPRLRVIDVSGRPSGDLTRLPHNGYYPNPEHGSPAWSPDGGRIAFILSGRLSIARRNGTDVRSIGPAWLGIADAHTRPAWSPDGRWLAVVRTNGDLYVVHPDGSGLRRLARAEWSSSPAWLPALPR